MEKTKNEIQDTLVELFRPVFVQLFSECASKQREADARRNELPKFVNVEGAMQITGLAKTSIYQMHSNGLIPGACKHGGRLMFRSADLVAWVESGRASSK